MITRIHEDFLPSESLEIDAGVLCEMLRLVQVRMNVIPSQERS